MELNEIRTVVNSLHNLLRDLNVMANTIEVMRGEITRLTDIYEKKFFEMVGGEISER